MKAVQFPKWFLIAQKLTKERQKGRDSFDLKCTQSLRNSFQHRIRGFGVGGVAGLVKALLIKLSCHKVIKSTMIIINQSVILFLEIVLFVLAVGLFLPISVLFVECSAALFPRQITKYSATTRKKVNVLVPAHNEASGIGATLKTLLPQLTEQDKLIVVADNCDDDTAAIAHQFGVTVIERQDPNRKAKGYALDYGLQFIALDPPDEAVFQKRFDLLAIALDLCVPPLSLLVIFWATSMGGALLAGESGASWIPAILLIIEGFLIFISIVGSWFKFGRSILPLETLLTIPLYILWKIPIYFAFLLHRETKWIRTQRDPVVRDKKVFLSKFKF